METKKRQRQRKRSQSKMEGPSSLGFNLIHVGPPSSLVPVAFSGKYWVIIDHISERRSRQSLFEVIPDNPDD